MSKLLEDPKVATLVEREVAKARRAAKAEVARVIKEAKEEVKEIEEKAVKTHAANLLKELGNELKTALDELANA
jgi:F0F1-type ATP synthase membrane subunit b/b'